MYIALRWSALPRKGEDTFFINTGVGYGFFQYYESEVYFRIKDILCWK